MSKLGQESAFPEITYKYTPNGSYPELMHHKGMSKRLYAACAAMQGLLAHSATTYPWKTLCNMSYELADELLKQENDG